MAGCIKPSLSEALRNRLIDFICDQVDETTGNYLDMGNVTHLDEGCFFIFFRHCKRGKVRPFLGRLLFLGPFMHAGGVHAKKNGGLTQKAPTISKKLSPTASDTVKGPCNHNDLYLWHRGSKTIHTSLKDTEAQIYTHRSTARGCLQAVLLLLLRRRSRQHFFFFADVVQRVGERNRLAILAERAN